MHNVHWGHWSEYLVLKVQGLQVHACDFVGIGKLHQYCSKPALIKNLGYAEDCRIYPFKETCFHFVQKTKPHRALVNFASVLQH